MVSLPSPASGFPVNGHSSTPNDLRQHLNRIRKWRDRVQAFSFCGSESMILSCSHFERAFIKFRNLLFMWTALKFTGQFQLMVISYLSLKGVSATHEGATYYSSFWHCISIYCIHLSLIVYILCFCLKKAGTHAGAKMRKRILICYRYPIMLIFSLSQPCHLWCLKSIKKDQALVFPQASGLVFLFH